MLKRNKKFNEGVAVGIRSFQGRLNSLSNSINEKYNTIPVTATNIIMLIT